MKTTILFIAYTVISGLTGLLLCAYLIWRPKSPRLTALLLVVSFGGPVAAYLYLSFQAAQDDSQLRRDEAYVKELCAKFGGDKIYKTVDNVEGVFQIRARNPDTDNQLGDQFGMFDPWGYEEGDTDNPGIPVGYSEMHYRYLEMPPAFGHPAGSPFRRKVSVESGMTVRDRTPDALPEKRDEAIWENRIFNVRHLRSHYGYVTEDISTAEMRRRWIAGGRIKIVDLQTKEVLAERTGYFRGVGRHALLSWSPTSASENCPHSSLSAFLLSVLRPASPVVPAPALVNSLIQE